MNRLFAILPCYNEMHDIGPLVEKWVEMAPKIEAAGFELSVYCVDDKSTDDTNNVIRQLERQHDIVHLIEHEVNKGLGGVLTTGFNFFANNGGEGDICVLMDGDNTHDPVYVIQMLDKIKAGYDCVIASRYCVSSETKGVSPIRLFMSWGARAYYSLILNVKGVKDYTCGYRAYTFEIIKKALDKYSASFIERRSFACMMEALYKLYTVGARFDEVPFELRYDNKQGESKMRVLKTAKESLSTALELRRKYKAR